ncbi:O-antigen ligase family protein [Deinococcus wulumuqiensis]|uniref:O-antigen ligase family protein n=1 Tax=Deinococcus wulumuqiensis TaxID=980427 RepID=UPI00242DB6F5|nr:O-antigen ligase family protein [Deinococcus wulumuqiensis]
MFINYFYTFPWYGYTYNIGDIRLSAAVNWWAGEYTRLSGFSRASYDVATQITVLYAILLAYNMRFFYKIILTFLSFLAIILTTSKGILISIVIVFLFSLLQTLQTNRKYLAPLSFIALWLISMLVILLPFASSMVNADYLSEKTGTSGNIFLTAFTSFASFGDRLAVMWPATTTRFESVNDYLFGLGIGSVGTPQSLYRNDSLSAVDNVALYLISSFGVIGGILFISIPLNIVRLGYKLMFDRLFIYLSTILVSYGMFSNAVELSYFPLLFGLLLGQVFFDDGRDHEDSTYS